MKKIIRLTESDLSRLVRRIIKENRFTSPKRQWEELLTNPDIKKFINRFNKYRSNELVNVKWEIKPVFSDVMVKFVDKSVPSQTGVNKFFDPHVSGSNDKYESGEIMFKYNDTTCIFKGILQGDSIEYRYDKTIRTEYNPPMTQEARQVARTFERMCESFMFRLRKDEVPTMYYNK